MRHSLAATLMAIVLSLGAGGRARAADGAAIAQNGTPQGAPACSLCHGKQGEGQPAAGFPRLAGLDAGYLRHELASFADRTRKNGMMTPIAKALSDADQQAVATYFASLNPPPATSKNAPAPELIAAGAELAQYGAWSKRLPACSQCHGPTGSGVGSVFPKLAGQSALYLTNQLTNWKKGDRHNDPMGLMASVAVKLDANQITSVAAYYASLPQSAARPISTPPAAVAAEKPAPQANSFAPPPDSAIPNNQFGAMVRLGENIFHDTQRYGAAFVGNRLQCGNCHIDRGRLAGSAPLWAAYVAYPAYRSKNDEVNTFEERIQGCFRYSMNGKAPPAGDKVLLALETYAYFLAKGAPTGADLPGRGYPKLKAPERLDYANGQQVYAQHCALCHGADGQGQSSPQGQIVFPPLWGAHSFNWGAGMGSIKNAAEFVKANMPLSLGGTLSEQEAWDVATYIDSQERPQDPRFTGSVAETRRKYHDTPMSMYGLTVNGVLLGESSPPSGTVPSAQGDH
ncbi:MAG: c-type cytochrome [Methylovirgula sp.]